MECDHACNEQPRLWFQYIVESNTLVEKEVSSRLEELAAISFNSLPSPKCLPGLLVIDQNRADVYEFLKYVTNMGCERVLVMIANTSGLYSDEVWQLIRAGATDVLSWEESCDICKIINEKIERWTAVDRLLESPLVKDNLVGESTIWKGVLRQIIEASCYTDASILIQGESGTGKELVARLIHTIDNRHDKGDLVVQDCTTIVPELSGSEFFGHERGAFTSANSSRKGAFALANGGTLFLDETGELPLLLQAQLLRVIQEGTFKKVGGNEWCNTCFRLICATNKNLLQEIERGQFRQDLYYRIAGWVCTLPPLRNRPSDVLPLVEHFLRQHRPDKPFLKLDQSVRQYFLERQYPGNIRELSKLVAHIVHRHVGDGPITVGDIPEDERPVGNSGSMNWRNDNFDNCVQQALTSGVGLKEIGRLAEDTAVSLAIQAEQGNLKRAARILGVSDRALQLRRAASRKGQEEKGRPNLSG